MFKIYRVRGESMAPTLHAGDFVIAQQRLFKIKRDIIVVARHPDYGVLIKRVKEIRGKSFLLSGENQQSLSPEEIGIIERQQILGKVICCIRHKKEA